MPIRMVVGLGNPGTRYRATRHNVGFCAVDELASEGIWNEHFLGLQSEADVNGSRLLLFRPLTYMNRSGIAVRRCAEHHRVSSPELLVVHDDMDLPLGRIRVRPGGGTGGHRGVESVANHLESTEFARLRIGIGRPPTGVSPREYVLMPFARGERDVACEVLRLSVRAIETAAAHSVQKAMNRYNGCDLRSQDE